MKKVLLTILTILLWFGAYCQTNNVFFKMPELVPASPESSALEKVSDIPVDYSSGAANINIPLYSIKEGSIELPIYLSYNTSGIRLQDISSMVGLGWNLEFGGIIYVKQQKILSAGNSISNSEFKQETDVINGDRTRALAFCGRIIMAATGSTSTTWRTI